MSDMKVCNQCKTEYPRTNEYFKNDKHTKDGLYGQCKQCVTKRTRAYNDANKDVQVANSKQYRQDNKEHRAEYQKQYREDNNKSYLAKGKQYRLGTKDSRSEYNKQYDIDHAEEKKARGREHRQSHMEEGRVKCQRYRAKKHKLSSTLTTKQWLSCVKYFDNKCAYCEEEKPLAQEHFVAVDNGGEYTAGNIVTSCLQCNSSKGVNEPMAWFRKQPTYTLAKENKILTYLGYKNNRQQLALF